MGDVKGHGRGRSLTVSSFAGYLGYSSGFSLSCMVFFLIAVIYKKFQVPCPLAHNLANATGNFSHMVVAEEKAQLQGESDAAEAFCTPSYFTLNSQVPTGQVGPGKRGGAWCGRSRLDIVPCVSRQHTPSPSWPSPSSATLRCCPYIQSSRSRCLRLGEGQRLLLSWSGENRCGLG